MPERSSPGHPTNPPSTSDRLYEEGFAFDFFQAVRLLQALDPGSPRVGHGGPPWAEPVRFRAHASLSFPPSAIHDLALPAGPGRPSVMVQAFLGLTGPNGVLPRHYTELLVRLDRERRGPDADPLRDWLDLFNHRLTSLFYRAWEKYRTFLGRERAGADHPGLDQDPFTFGLLSFVGLGTPSLRNRLVVGGGVEGRGPSPPATSGARVDDFSLVHYSGLLSNRPRSAIGLEAILHDYFGLGVEILQFRGRWLALEPASQSRLASGKAGNRLGVDAVIGERAWDIQGLFRVRLGPLTYGQFLEYLPDRSRGRGSEAPFLLAHLVRLYAGPEFDFDLQLVLKVGEVPQCRLPVGGSVGAILGWNSWLASEPLAADADDAVFSDVDLLA
jgi:type VI secretion system protein ImpH